MAKKKTRKARKPLVLATELELASGDWVLPTTAAGAVGMGERWVQELARRGEIGERWQPGKTRPQRLVSLSEVKAFFTPNP